MTSVASALDDAFDELGAKLERLPNAVKEADLRDGLFRAWMQAARFDELIECLWDRHEREGGLGDASILSEALKRSHDLSRIETLLGGLLASRKKAFARVFKQAQEAHNGAMRESAKYMAAVMEAYAGLYRG